MRKTFTMPVDKLEENQVLVIPTDEQGKHDSGLSLFALINCGAKLGQAYGKQGSCYGIVLKDFVEPNTIETIKYIKAQLRLLYSFALYHTNTAYLVGLSGNIRNTKDYNNIDLARLFIIAAREADVEIPDNIIFETKFQELINVV